MILLTLAAGIPLSLGSGAMAGEYAVSGINPIYTAGYAMPERAVASEDMLYPGAGRDGVRVMPASVSFDPSGQDRFDIAPDLT
ncbi:MAG: hypothetical protein PGN23_05095 [Sphingomonas adhaesiva]|uniref:hypothetical protein n=1 Tax=Sphingomonas adhaesiva TaxID=28212 RepID=UPI002FFA333A